MNIKGDGWCIWRCIASAVLCNALHDVDLSKIADDFLDMLNKFAGFVSEESEDLSKIFLTDETEYKQKIIQLPALFKVFIKF